MSRLALYSIVWWAGWGLVKYFDMTNGWAYGIGFLIAVVWEARDRQLRTQTR